MSYQKLLEHAKTTTALSQALELLHWDQETMMPKRGGENRAEQCAALEQVIHARRTAPEFLEWLDAAEKEAPSTDSAAELKAANLAELKRQYERATQVPGSLVAELARLAAQGHNSWASARKQEDFKVFAPTLKRLVELKQQEAACLQHAFPCPYDALLDAFEPNTQASWLRKVFTQLRAELTQLVGEVQARQAPCPAQGGPFDQQAQLRLSQMIAKAMGYRFDAGRLDLAVHPFSSGSQGDVRITTRVDPNDLFNCLYSTIHEVGHALYEQNIPPELWHYPCGAAVSMGVHESQSRLWENQVARSLPFLQWLFPKLQEHLPQLGPQNAEELYRSINHVAPSLIRTEADEVTYNLHIILRFDLEMALIDGSLIVDDLEAAWNDRVRSDFGLEVPRPSLGVLQDIHWSSGYFGYFPTYALGNIYAAELWQAYCGDHEQWAESLRGGELEGVLQWLRSKIHSHGKLLPAPQLVAKAVGRQTSERALLAYLRQKFANAD